MGVNSLILLPPDARIDDVSQVIGILAGLPAHKQFLDGDSFACRVPGVKAEPSSMAEMATITVNGDLIDGETNHFTTWHWEPDRVCDGQRLLYPKANPFWIAVGLKLVDFFGGSIVYSDCKGDVPDYTAKRPRAQNNPSDGLPWQTFQNEKLELKPITQAELEQANKWAAYKMERTA